MSEDRIEELKEEIERIELDENPDSDSFARLKALKKELQALDLESERQEAERRPSVRPLSARDLKTLKSLLDSFPSLEQLQMDERLDAIVMGLIKGCGLSAVTPERIKEALSYLQWSDEFDLELHLSDSTWTNREGQQRRRYISPFEGVYKLDPGYILKLNEQVRVRAEDNPIRKVIVNPEPSSSDQRPRIGTGSLRSSNLETLVSNEQTELIQMDSASSEAKSDEVPVSQAPNSQLVKIGWVAVVGAMLILVIWILLKN